MWFSVVCFGVRVSVMFHLMFVYYRFRLVWIAEWPLFGKYLQLGWPYVVIVLCLFVFFIYFPFWFEERDLDFDCSSSFSLFFYYFHYQICYIVRIFCSAKHNSVSVIFTFKILTKR